MTETTPTGLRMPETGTTSPRARHIEPEKALNALPAGSIVLTLDGALPVEFLGPGDRVITRDSGTATLRHIRRQTARIKTVAIKAGALGNMRPEADVILPAQQEILIRDWRAAALFGAPQALVPAARLVDGEFIRDLGTRAVDLIELVFDSPHILYCDGLEVAAACALQTAGR